MATSVSEILDQVLFLYEGYSKEHRATTQPFHLKKVQKIVKNYVYSSQDFLVREPLIEHSGSLPVIATTLFPYLENENVDLGHTLIMLAIHDIGELITGDEITFTKNKSKASEEQKHALNLLPRYLHESYLEMEERSTDTAKFAKAVDKITPDIIDILTPPEITIIRFKEYANIPPKEIVPTIKKFKHPYMIWNPFMKTLHLEILLRLEKLLKIYY